VALAEVSAGPTTSRPVIVCKLLEEAGADALDIISGLPATQTGIFTSLFIA